MVVLLQSFHSQTCCLSFSQAKCPTPRKLPLFHIARMKERNRSICLASSHECYSKSDLIKLPICPLPMVLFPGALLPLEIDDYRSRIMMHTVLQTDDKFGVLFSNPRPSAREPFPLEIGCVAEVVEFQTLSDGRFSIICKGLERFRIAHIESTIPYMVATVTRLEDRPPDSEQADDLEKLVSDVEEYIKCVARLSRRFVGMEQDDQIDYVDIRNGMSPTPFSLFVASKFDGEEKQRQELLELEDTAARLEREKDILANTISYFRALIALKDAFPSP